MSRSYTFRIPASTSNLGPGFDALSLALEMYLQISIDVLPPGSITTIEARGCDAGKIPLTAENLILRVADYIAVHRARPLPPLRMSIDNQIPLARGLGSSAAAIIAGATVYELARQDPLPLQELFLYCREFESHPDNLAAALSGGLVIAAVSDSGEVLLAKQKIDSAIQPVVVIPDFELSTERARAALPKTYSREDVVFNIQRSALTVVALISGNHWILREAMRDHLHQPFRAPLIPGFDEVLTLDVPGLLGVALSGAGPTVLAFAPPGAADSVGRAIAATFGRHGVNATPHVLNVDEVGREVM